MKKLLILLLYSVICKNGISQLSYIDRIYQGFGGVDGIMSPSSMVISPDDKNIYVIGNKRTISVFKYNKQNKDLEYIECMIEGEKGVNGIYGIFQIEFSPDGKYLYGVLQDSSSIVVFHRDTVNNGKLSLIQTIKNSTAKHCLTSVSRILVTKNGKFVYSVSQVSNKIGVFKRNQITGFLTFTDTVKTNISGGANYISSSYDSKNLYSCSYGDLKNYQIDSITGKLTLNQELTMANLFNVYFIPQALTLSPNGRFLYASCYDNRIILLQRDTINGNLTPIQVFSLDNYSNIIGSNSIVNHGVITKDNKHLLVAIDLSDVAIKLKIDSLSGSLSTDTIVYKSNCTINPYNSWLGEKTIAISNDQNMVFVVSSYDNNIMVLDNHTNKKGMSLLKTISYGDNGLNRFNSPYDFVITNNLKYVYAISGDDSTIHCFSRDINTGSLINLNKSIKSNYLKYCCKIAISEDNKNLYVCSNTSYTLGSSISVFSIDTTNGNFSLIQNIPNNDSNEYGSLNFSDIICSNDNKNVYALSSSNDIIKIYYRDLVTGQLTFSNNITVQPIGSASYFNANKMIISKDDKFVYLISYQGIKTLSRSYNGQLYTIQTINCSLYYWGYSFDAKLTDDQSSLFILNNDAPYLVKYERNSSTGLLQYNKKYLTQNEPNLYGVQSLCISKDKNYIYIGSGFKSQILIARLNPNNSNYEKFKIIEGLPLGTSVATTTSIKTTSDNRSLYALSNNNKTLTNYRPKLCLGNSITACLKDKVILSSNGKYASYKWSTGGTNDTIMVSSTNTYKLTATNFFGEPETDSVYVFFKPLPNVDLGLDKNICSGDSVTLSPNRNFIGYLWNTGSTNKSIVVSKKGKYSITIKDTINDCSNLDSIYVNILPLPDITISGNKDICYGDSVDILASGDLVSYSWNNGLGNKPKYKVAPKNTTTYTVTGIDSNNCANKASTIIGVNPLPNIYAPNVELCFGSSVDLSAYGGSYYVWSNGMTGKTIKVSPSETTVYYVIGTDNKNCSKKSETIATVNPIPSTPIITRTNDTLRSNYVSGNQWYINNSIINGATNQYTKLAQNGKYFVIVTINGCSSDTSSAINILDTGIKQSYDNSNLKLYPNPTKDRITLEFKETLVDARLLVLNCYGQELLNQEINTAIIQLDIRNWSKGIYFVRLINNNSIVTKKIIKE